MMLRVLVMLALTIFPVQAQTQDIPGAKEPQFIAAMFDWLQDDDARALPSLHALAVEGNIAAQMFLMVATRDADLISPDLATMERTTRLALARDADGQLWQNTLDGVHPISDALIRSYRRTDTLADLDLMIPLNDWRSFSRIVGKSNYKPGRAGDLLPYVARRAIPQSLIAHIWQNIEDGDTSPEDRAIATQQLQSAWARSSLTAVLLYGRVFTLEGQIPDSEHQSIRTLAGLLQHGTLPPRYNQPVTPKARAALRGSLIALPEMTPFRSFCTATCPGSIPTCLEAAFTAQGGFTATGAGWSPITVLVNNHTFLESPRGRISALRAGRGSAASPVMLNHLYDIDACYASALEDESRLFP